MANTLWALCLILVLSVAAVKAVNSAASEAVKSINAVRQVDPWGGLLDPFVKENEIISMIDDVIVEEKLLGDVMWPIDWLHIGTKEFEKKRDLIEMPDLGLGCSAFEDKTSRNYYDFYEFRNCQWTPVNTFPKFEVIKDWSTNSSFPVLSYLPFPFFNTIMKPPHVFMVSSNGYITVTPGDNTGQGKPNLEKRNPPFNVIAALFTKLTPRINAKVRYGNFRMGYKVLCTKFEWTNFTPRGAERTNKVTVQLDICSNGYFTSRIKHARNLRDSQIGLNYGNYNVYKYSALPLKKNVNRYPSYSAVVMKPTKFNTFHNQLLLGLEPTP